MAHARILQRVFVGGCPRDVTACSASSRFRRPRPVLRKTPPMAGAICRPPTPLAARSQVPARMGQNCGARPCLRRAAAFSSARLAVGGVLSAFGLRRRRGARAGAPRPPRSRATCAGFCGEVDARDMSPAEIEARAEGRARSLQRLSPGQAFSWKCRASWPCAAPCKRDFGSCPEAGRRGGPLGRDDASAFRRRGGVKAMARARRRRNIGACAGDRGGPPRVGRPRPAALRAAAPLISSTVLRRRKHRGRSCAMPRGSPPSSGPVARESLQRALFRRPCA